MKNTEFKDLVLFITGPTYIRPEIRQAGTYCEFGHRDKVAKVKVESILKNLRKLAGVNEDYEVCLVCGSGSFAMEASIRSLVKDNENILNVSVGAFGDLYHKMTASNKKNVDLLKFKPGKAIDLNKLEEQLKSKKYDVVTFTHNETSTGVTNDMVKVCKLIQKYGAMPLVDGVSIFGGVKIPFDEAKPSVYITSTQKCLGLPAGFGIMFVHKDALEKAKSVESRGYVTDLVSIVASGQKSQTVTTPNCTLINQMMEQLEYIVEEEGIDNRFKRHEDMQKMVADWVENSLSDDFKFFSQEGYRSPVVSAIEIPKYVDRMAIKESLREKGYLFDPGYGKLNKSLEENGENLNIRVGHMGDITPEMLSKYLEELESEFKKYKP
ncbi:aminotransferase class V-fold PLP-dependent enzyme [Herbivorax sp. ANBcel31]|uniref:pyridoxal-phosphate-dependent aminotransferase family protein n=1 Tax=Herbivorax sp. ANBcel31 TaxID=3069754 RepID=UPI0027B181E1|nr:aminotransferase class V-fold PLP-dependent enzyme [Herbivorax sp. ANBcel31]MDQ2086824.1 aminotransferase class V-fold PLP-dependent enzyme [Herbivorax sp. ANBcel31]